MTIAADPALTPHRTSAGETVSREGVGGRYVWGGGRGEEGVNLRSQDMNSCMSGNNPREDFFHKSWDYSK